MGAIATQDGLEPLKGQYGPEITLAGLHALAAHGGDSNKAHAILKETYGDNAPSDRTLRHWRANQYPNRYQHILSQHSTELETLVEHQLRESIRLNGLAKHKALQRLHDTIDTIDPKELGKTVQQLAVAEGVGIDKMLVLTGRPNNITEARNADEILKALEARTPKHTDTTATEEPADQADIASSLPSAADQTRVG